MMHRELKALMADADFPWRAPAGGSWIVSVSDFRAYAERALGTTVHEAHLDEFVESLGGQRRRMVDVRASIGRLLGRDVQDQSADLYEIPPPEFRLDSDTT